jgi:hypothetical protein
MSQDKLTLTKSIGRVDASDMGITVALNYLIKDADDNFVGRAGVTVALDGHEERSINDLRDLASQRADDLLSQIVLLLPPRPQT